MIRDGVDAVPIALCQQRCQSCPRPLGCGAAERDARLRAQGWKPISTAPIAQLDLVLQRGRQGIFATAPNWIEGLTTHGNVVLARYFADGRYGDQWTNDRGNVRYMLTHWRAVPRNSEHLR